MELHNMTVTSQKTLFVAGVSGPYHYLERDGRCDVNDEDRVWPLDGLDLLDKLGTPAWLAISSSFSDPTRSGILLPPA